MESYPPFLWREIVDLLNSLEYKRAYLFDTQIILGEPKIDPMINEIIIATTYLIFKGKSKNKFSPTKNSSTITKRDFGVFGHQYGIPL